MAVSLPYLNSYKNLPLLLEKIATAKVPDTFSQTFLAQTLGLRASTDRPLIPFLRTLGVLDGSNKPTVRYHVLRNKGKVKREIAKATRDAYRPLFDADENVNSKSGDELKGLVSQVAGTDEDATKKIAYTFQALARLADFTPDGEPVEEDQKPEEKYAEATKSEGNKQDDVSPSAAPAKLRTEFHYNIQVHLPSNATEDTYLNIFNAIRRVFQ